MKDRSGAVIKFDVPGAAVTYPRAINNRGTIVGSSVDAGTTLNPDGSFPPGSVHGFVRKRNGPIATFDVPGAALTDFYAINDRGQIAGRVDKNQDTPQTFLRERSGAITIIDVPGANPQFGLSPNALNDRGQVVGTYADAGAAPDPDGTAPPNALHGFRWDSGRVRTLDIPGSVSTAALGINNRGQISGGYEDPAGRQHGFVMNKGRYTTLDAPRPLDDFSRGNIAAGINDRGEIVIPDPGTRIVPVAP